MQCIYLFTTQEAEIVGNSRQSSSVVNFLDSFFMAPHKSSSSFLWLFPFPLHMIHLKKPFLFAPPGFTDHDKATSIVSSNLSIHLPPGHWLSMKFLPAEAYQCKKGVSQFIPLLLMLTFQIIYQYPIGVSQCKQN